MKLSAKPWHIAASPYVRLLELLGVLLGVAAGGIAWIAWMILGVALNVVAFPFPDHIYTYEWVWNLASGVVALAAAVLVWFWTARSGLER